MSNYRKLWREYWLIDVSGCFEKIGAPGDEAIRLPHNNQVMWACQYLIIIIIHKLKTVTKNKKSDTIFSCPVTLQSK